MTGHNPESKLSIAQEKLRHGDATADSGWGGESDMVETGQA
jgi:hypothetical protein